MYAPEYDAHVIHSAESYVCARGMTDIDAARIVACVNACANIPTETLAALEWQLAPKAGAKPVEVAKLILKLSEYREALAKIAAVGSESFAFVGDLSDIARDALK